LFVVDLVSDEEQDDNGSSEVVFEEILSSKGGMTSNREQSDVELSDETEDIEAETNP